MAKPGAAIVGLDGGGHIWIVLSAPTPKDEIAVVMLFKHGRPKRLDHASCTVIRCGEYQKLRYDVCVEMRRSALKPRRSLLEDMEDRRERRRLPTVAPAILYRIQQAVLTSEIPPKRVRDAIRQTIECEALPG